jgi:hypothetical protein
MAKKRETQFSHRLEKILPDLVEFMELDLSVQTEENKAIPRGPRNSAPRQFNKPFFFRESNQKVAL